MAETSDTEDIRTKGQAVRAEAVDRVKVVFTLFDVDGNGVLEATDFDQMADRVVRAAPESDEQSKTAMVNAFRRYWQTLLTELDTNHDGKVSYEEYEACVLSPERFEATIDDFAESLAALGDPDGDGLIERPLFVALMTAIGFAGPNIDALFDAFRPTPDDRIEVPVWATGIREYYHPDMAGISGDQLVG
jgi:Ca2+-binding EF-hand superfamily protein